MVATPIPPYTPLSDRQARQAIDTEQAFVALEATQSEALNYQGGMHWKTVNGREYLYRTIDRRGNAKSIGPRSANTEEVHDAFHRRKTQLAERAKALGVQLDVHRRLNVALRLGSAPAVVASICERLRVAGLAKSLTVIGTNALYCYEAIAGVRFVADVKATMDLDLLWDVRRKLSVAAAQSVSESGLLGVLRKVDRTFEVLSGQRFRAVNQDGYMVGPADFITRCSATTFG